MFRSVAVENGECQMQYTKHEMDPHTKHTEHTAFTPVTRVQGNTTTSEHNEQIR